MKTRLVTAAIGSTLAAAALLASPALANAPALTASCAGAVVTIPETVVGTVVTLTRDPGTAGSTTVTVTQTVDKAPTFLTLPGDPTRVVTWRAVVTNPWDAPDTASVTYNATQPACATPVTTAPPTATTTPPTTPTTPPTVVVGEPPVPVTTTSITAPPTAVQPVLPATGQSVAVPIVAALIVSAVGSAAVLVAFESKRRRRK